MIQPRSSIIFALSFAFVGVQARCADDEVDRIASRVDRALAATWKANGIQPAGVASDAVFFRRASLDLTGCIPTAAEARAFVADRRPDKRRHCVEEMLAGPRHVRHAVNLWCEQLLPTVNGPTAPAWRAELESWLAKQIRDKAPYDRLIRELLTTSLTFEPGKRDNQATPLPFFRANDLKPENLAASVSRVFLGISLDCAQCHNHPFAPWTKTQFAAFAAFFASARATRVQSGRVVSAVDADEPRAFALPNSPAAAARFLDGRSPKWVKGRNPRATLADWMTAPDNPYVARHAVNRLWAQLFGAELVGEEDSLLKGLLDDLGQELIRGQYDLDRLTAGLVASAAYQLSSVSGPAESGSKLFARARVRGLSAEQLCDNLIRAGGYREPFDAGKRAEFVARFQQIGERHADRQISVLQVLSLMNGPLLNDIARLDRGPALAAIVEAPWLDTAGRIEALYYATLSRAPNRDELSRLVALVERSGKESERRQALADVFWALLNSSEFLFNH